jgi:hypothetical protein
VSKPPDLADEIAIAILKAAITSIASLGPQIADKVRKQLIEPNELWKRIFPD